MTSAYALFTASIVVISGYPRDEGSDPSPMAEDREAKMCGNFGFLLPWDWEAETAGVWCFLVGQFFFYRVSWVVGRKCGGVERGRREKPLRNRGWRGYRLGGTERKKGKLHICP